MKFLILLFISIFSLPTTNVIKKIDGVFLAWQNLLNKFLPKLKFYWIFFLSIILPLIFIFLVLFFLAGRWWNIPLFFTTLLFLYYALDNRQDIIWLAKYTKAYEIGDVENMQKHAYCLLENIACTKDLEVPEDYFVDRVLRQEQILKKIIWLGFETFFLPLFWYLVSTPLSPVFVKFLEISIKNKMEKDGEVDSILLKIQALVHWFPAKFFGLTMTLAAFSRNEFKKWWQDKFDFSISTQDYLYNQVKYYLHLNYRTKEAEIFSEKAHLDLWSLKDLLWRTLALWLGIGAIIVIVL